jgi:ADP-ribosyl-[dinitrogen reductase] hydrolase
MNQRPRSNRAIVWRSESEAARIAAPAERSCRKVLMKERAMAGGAKQDRFLGALMGMAIGDALGMPVSGWSAEQIAERYGRIESYHARTFADGSEIGAGEFTEESEMALCIVESFTVNNGELDVDNIGARFLHLARGEAKRWIPSTSLNALLNAEESLHFVQPLDEDGPATGDVAARGIPLGLIHAAGAFDFDRLRADAETVTRITHGSPAAIAATTAVALLVRSAARGDAEPVRWARDASEQLGAGETADALRRVAAEPSDLEFGESTAAVVSSAVAIAAGASSFPEAVYAAVNSGGPTDSRGAIAGAIAGARFGIAGIPQAMIDTLEGRIYVSLAAPWFYRAVMRRAGLVIDLRTER